MSLRERTEYKCIVAAETVFTKSICLRLEIRAWNRLDQRGSLVSRWPCYVKSLELLCYIECVCGSFHYMSVSMHSLLQCHSAYNFTYC